MHFQHVDSVIMYVLVVVAGYYWMIGIHTIYIWHGNVSYHYSLYEWSKNVVTEAISILLRAIMRTTIRNYTYDTRLGVFISVMDRNNFHIIQTSMFLESDTPKEQNLRLVNMKVSMYFLLIIYPVKDLIDIDKRQRHNLYFERFYECDNRCFFILHARRNQQCSTYYTWFGPKHGEQRNKRGWQYIENIMSRALYSKF